ncbi:multidrug MFS transporter [Sulfitobacter donghicola DSW-25 = KCTC 12864 = JCM 14565]|uniref:Multidrug MFS transporter n=2 Tax=Sulfitobacter TaxID=60136 RepID=A0A073IDI8_9RHOB|nr:multidrug effflux MFS transporter [Sulfitobacter donghicola]KEJ88428.1 multidrug MFS transporter [Sulfitobacter donghicola DSW-25 = KCTC 12864 = JCM 14565]
MGRTEFVALMAMMMAAIAFSIDSILPALPTIAAELSPDAPQQAPLILSMFLLGLGVGTFFTGPLSDAYGRKPLILFASGLYILGAAVAWAAQSLEVILFARVLQGLGASGPRVVSIAIVRDRFAGRQMAQVVSIIMMIFTLVPAVAPLLGEFIIHLTGWRGIFLSFILFAVIICVWMSFRLPETLPVEDRRPMRLTLMFSAVKEMAKHQVVRLSIFVQTLIMGCLFLTLMLVQQVYDLVYARADEFPYWFFLVAILSGSAGLLNALLVVRFGMYRLVTLALAFQILFSGAFVLFDLGAGPYGFFFFVFWQTTIFFQAGMTLGNLNALAMEPMGHIAGMAASVIGALSTVGAVLISGPLGTMIHGDERLLAACVFVLAFVGCLTMLWMGRALKKQAVG